MLRWAREEKPIIRQLYQRFASARGQRTLIGTGVQIAAEMAQRSLNYGVDRFLVQPSHRPGGLVDFIARVVPKLQERGLFRSEYEGATSRDRLGLPRPISRWHGACNS